MRHLIGALPIPKDERLLVGVEDADDAAVYQLDANRSLVVTTDVITPLVDDARTFGSIAAANALADVWAMGGKPLLSLSILGVPRDFPEQLSIDIALGGAELAAAAGAPVVGGHSIESRDLIFGLAVVGEAHPAHLFVKRAVLPGDVLILTKPLGTGVLTTAAKRDVIPADELTSATAGMLQTHREALPVLHAAGVRAATDISGFGLLGHAAEMARASGVQLVLNPKAVPSYPLANDLFDRGVRTRGNAQNLAYAEQLGPLLGEPPLLLTDPQTSGGLLIAIAADKAAALVQALKVAGYVATQAVGEAREGRGLLISG